MDVTKRGTAYLLKRIKIPNGKTIFFLCYETFDGKDRLVSAFVRRYDGYTTWEHVRTRKLYDRKND